jgi:hypothetical protein
MAQPADTQLIFEVLKKVQSDVAVIKADVAEVKFMMKSLLLRLDRIETRLNLTDA